MLIFASTEKNKMLNSGKVGTHNPISLKPKKVYQRIFPWFHFLDKEMLTANWDESVEKFDDLSLKEEVLRGIYGYGFVKPSPIQQKGILPVIQGKDTIAQV